MCALMSGGLTILTSNIQMQFKDALIGSHNATINQSSLTLSRQHAAESLQRMHQTVGSVCFIAAEYRLIPCCIIESATCQCSTGSLVKMPVARVTNGLVILSKVCLRHVLDLMARYVALGEFGCATRFILSFVLLSSLRCAQMFIPSRVFLR